MIGIIVAGHAGLASEMLDVIAQIESPQRNMTSVDYRAGETPDIFLKNFNSAVEQLEADSEGILIFTDSARGTPYKTAVKFSEVCDEFPVIVITGFNLPGLVETAMARMYLRDVEMLADLAVEHGKKQVMRYGGAQKVRF